MGYSEAEIVQGLKDNDRRIVAYMYDRYRPIILDYVHKNSGELEDAKDLCHISFMCLIENIRKSKYKPGNIHAYFNQLFRNQWKKQLEKMKKQSFTSIEDLIQEIDWDEAEMGLRIKHLKLIEILVENLQKLNERCRQMLDLFYFKKWSQQEIGDKMAITYGSVRVQMVRCRNSLANICMEDHHFSTYFQSQ